ncbi:MAG: cupin domain-containing protein [Verrucomicrobiota bacterium]
MNSLDSNRFNETLGFMPNQSHDRWKFVSFADAEVEEVPPGKTHFWYCRPSIVPETNTLFVRAHLQPGAAHNFHYHPGIEEILYVLSGTAEQWVGEEYRKMGPGDSLYLPPDLVHATFNVGKDVLDFLAILAPAKTSGPITIEVGDQEPWLSLRG